MNELTTAIFMTIALCLIMYAAVMYLMSVDGSPKWVLPMLAILAVVVTWLYLEMMR